MSDREILEENSKGARKWWQVGVYLTVIGLIGFVLWITYLTQNLSVIIKNQNYQQTYFQEFDNVFYKFDSLQREAFKDRDTIILNQKIIIDSVKILLKRK